MGFIKWLLIFTIATTLQDFAMSYGSGKYKYCEIQEFQVCDDVEEEEWPIRAELRADSNGEMGCWLNMTLGEALDENVGIDFMAEKSSPGAGWQPFYPYEDKDVCESAHKMFPEFMEAIHECAGLVDGCPIAAGDYQCKNLQTRYKFRSFPEMPAGKYRVTVKLTLNDERVSCIQMVGEVVPEQQASFG